MRMIVAALVVGGCYDPDVRDCTVTCTRTVDCIAGQTCSAAGLCAAPGVTCHSAAGDAADAGDAGDSGDSNVELKIEIDGPGSVALDGIATCAASCEQLAPMAQPVTAHAIAGPKQAFDGWTTPPCVGQPATCTFVPTTPTVIGVHF